MAPKNSLLGLIVVYTVTAFVFAFIAKELPSYTAVPYNIRELFSESWPVLTGIAFFFLLIWVFGVPVGMALWLRKGASARGFVYPFVVFGYGFIVWLILRLAVPIESIENIVGSPILGWPREFETMVRVNALMLAPAIVFSGVAAIGVDRFYESRMAGSALQRWFIPALILLCLSHWIVVSQAATDNLIELMADRGSWKSSLLFAFWFTLLAATASSITIGLVRRNISVFWWGILLIVVSVPLGYQLLVWATEPFIIKYEKLFSAMQFLFSPDRDHYVAGSELFMRYGIFHLMVVALASVAQFPFWHLMVRRKTSVINDRGRKDEAIIKREINLDIKREIDREIVVPAYISRKSLCAIAVLYTAFVVYGSLVPLDYQPLTLDQAWLLFQRIPFLDLGIHSRADWVANILLFIPLAFLWQGVIWPRHSLFLQFLSAVMLGFMCFVLSLLTEFAQLFFPARTVSQNDILAETIGSAIGIAFWWWRGLSISNWLAHWQQAQGPMQLNEKLLRAYLVVLFAYNLLPLDLTISPVEIYHQWREGKILFIPFSFWSDDFISNIYNVSTDILIWVPVTCLIVVSKKKSLFQAWISTVIAAIGLEIMQLFVYSRTSDTTDILTAMIGAGMGAWFSRRWATTTTTAFSEPDRLRLIWGIVMFAGSCLVLAFIFWYPFDFILKKDFISDRLDNIFSRVPFYTYYYGTEYRAATELLHKTLFFAPLGFALALVQSSLSHPTLKNLFNIGAILMLGLVAFTIELGQLALPNRISDITDWLLEIIGGSAAYFFSLFIFKRRQTINRTVIPKSVESL